MERCEDGADSWSPGGSGVGREGQALQGMGSWVPMTRPMFASPLLLCREALLAEMGVAVREDGGTVGVFSPKKVSEEASETLDAERRGLGWQGHEF